jgi:hypothetical protein
LIDSRVSSILSAAMKKFGAYLSLLGLLFQTSSQAWVGGPYSNNTYDGFDGGIFSGTIRGTACSGIFKFSTDGGDAYVSPFGDSIVYYKGLAYYGECFGQVDFDAKRVSGYTNGSNVGANQNDPSAGPLSSSVFGNGFPVQNGLGNGVKSATANSYWNGKITKSKQTLRFKAKGEMSFFGNATEITTFTRVFSAGVFADPTLDADTGRFLDGTSSTPGTGFTTTTRTENSAAVSPDTNYPNITNKIKVKIYGSRTSVVGFAGPNTFLGTAR